MMVRLVLLMAMMQMMAAMMSDVEAEAEVMRAATPTVSRLGSKPQLRQNPSARIRRRTTNGFGNSNSA